MTSRPRKALNRSDWLEAALRALEKGGVDAVRVLPLAAALGASRGSFYWHFENRSDLLESVLAFWEAQATDAVIEHASSTPGKARARFLELLEDILLHRRGRYDPAVRAWELHDPMAAKVVRHADRKRLAYVNSLFRDLGFGPAESEARARLTYAYLLGDHCALAKESAAKRKKYLQRRYRLLTAR